MEKRELNEMEQMSIAGGLPIDSKGNRISGKEYEELRKQREKENAEKNGYDYYNENGVTLLTKKF